MANQSLPDDVLTPRAIIIPVVTPASTWANATKGTIVMSGAKLYIHSGTTFELITSA